MIFDGTQKYCFWFDLQIDPCVQFFAPIVDHLRKKEHIVKITYRKYSNIQSLLQMSDLSGKAIGSHGGKTKIGKFCATVYRAFKLALCATGKKFDLAVGFGSRPLALCCKFKRIANATILDYEYVSFAALKSCCRWIFLPDLIGFDFIKSIGLKSAVLTTSVM